jgi:SAM-dependent methyltransferase
MDGMRRTKNRHWKNGRPPPYKERDRVRSYRERERERATIVSRESISSNIPMDGDEMQTAVSYYVLYAELAAIAEQKQNHHHDEQQPVGESEDGHEAWADDDWTEERIKDAMSQLAANEALCDVASSSAKGSYLVQQYEQNAGKHWDDFYSRHRTNFFKDRHYLHKTFPEEFGPLYEDSSSKGKPAVSDGRDFTVMEIGCGVGNTVLPLLERGEETVVNGERRRICVWGLDFARVAIDLLKKDRRFSEASAKGRARAGVWDITLPPPQSYNIENISDVSILLFCLSAISPEKMPDAARHAASTLKPGGTLVLRDYGRYDEAQMKLGTSRCKQLGDNFYVKSDGTRCYYFELEDLRRSFGPEGAGLEVLELKYLRRVYSNRSQDVERRRVWVQARFRKKSVPSSEGDITQTLKYRED